MNLIKIDQSSKGYAVINLDNLDYFYLCYECKVWCAVFLFNSGNTVASNLFVKKQECIDYLNKIIPGEYFTND